MPLGALTTDPGASWRQIISCDYCALHWHLDCLSPPMAAMPNSGRKWMCPNHVEQAMVSAEAVMSFYPPAVSTRSPLERMPLLRATCLQSPIFLCSHSTPQFVSLPCLVVTICHNNEILPSGAMPMSKPHIIRVKRHEPFADARSQARRRTLRTGLQIVDVESAGQANNGNIQVMPDEDRRGLDFEDLVINKKKYRVPEKIIKLDFWEKLRTRKWAFACSWWLQLTCL